MAYRAVIDGVTIVFFQYQYTEQQMEYNAESHTEEQRSVTYTFTIINAEINKTVPAILLLHHSLLSKLASLGEHSGMQQLQLEGDFNKHFDCYITPNDQVNALSLLAPDVMAQLIDKLPDASVEFTGRSMGISLAAVLLEADKIGPLLNNTVSVVKSIENRE